VNPKNQRNESFLGKQFGSSATSTLAKLAKLAHIHPSYAADVQRGERNLSLLNILKLAAALRVHPGKLFVKF